MFNHALRCQCIKNQELDGFNIASVSCDSENFVAFEQALQYKDLVRNAFDSTTENDQRN